jgi:hypothetical protein
MEGAAMEEEYYADRARLQHLLQAKPQASVRELMADTQRSETWVKKWRRRLRAAEPGDTAVLEGLSRRRHVPPWSPDEVVVAKILNLRDTLPTTLGRVAGAKPILYHLHRDTALWALHTLPYGESTIKRILREHGRIVQRSGRPSVPVKRPAPMARWEVDFAYDAPREAEENGTETASLETLHVVDAGTSILVDIQPRRGFCNEKAIEALVVVFQEHGLPPTLTFDRDPRFVGGSQRLDLPAAWVRFVLCLGVTPDICPPRRPDLKPFVEREIGSYKREFGAHCPTDQAREQPETYQAYCRFYNEERPHQGDVCGNRPPKVAFPELPTLPTLPNTVDPDAWLKAYQGKVFTRRLSTTGSIQLGNDSYYVKRALARQTVTIQVDATEQTFLVRQAGHLLKRLPIKGLYRERLPFWTYYDLIRQEARREWRRHLLHQRTRR